MGSLDNHFNYDGLTAERTLVVMLHDLRTPVTSITELSKLLLENSQTLTDEEMTHHLQVIHQYARVIKAVTDSATLSDQVLSLNE